MQQHNDVFKQLSLVATTQFRWRWPWRRLLFLMINFTIILVNLACVFGGSTTRSAADQVVFLTRLPTLTRTPLPTLTPTANPTAVAMALPTEVAATAAAPLASPTTAIVPPAEAVNAPVTVAANAPAAPTEAPPASVGIVPATVTPNPEVVPAEIPPTNSPTATELPPPTSPSTATATVAPSPSPLPTEYPTATPPSEGWDFAAVRAAFDPDEESLMLHGELVNNTGAAQELIGIAGTFYNEQGQVIADGDTEAHWPVAAVAPHGRVPFELLVPDLTAAANFDLRVDSKGSNGPPRQDFEFLDVRPTVTEPDYYCVSGALRNSGDNLMSYLVVVAILYDGQDNILDFGAYTVFYPRDLTSGQTRAFEICANPLGQPVARYELRAWGL